MEMLTPLKSLKETCWISLEIVPDPPREQPGSLQKIAGSLEEKSRKLSFRLCRMIDALILSQSPPGCKYHIIFMHSPPTKTMQNAKSSPNPIRSHGNPFHGCSQVPQIQDVHRDQRGAQPSAELSTGIGSCGEVMAVAPKCALESLQLGSCGKLKLSL